MPRRWLWLSVPIALLAIPASAAGILVDSVYEKETANWAAQAVGQDIANLAAYAAMLILARRAARGSLRAYLAWTGTLVYSVYTYAIYAFEIHFGPFFPVYVAVFGLSVYLLVGALAALDPARVKASFGERVPVRWAATLLLVIGIGFCGLWLAEILPAILDDKTPETLIETGLATNPVWVLDLGLFLPAAILTGVLLLRRRPLGYTLAPTMLGAFALIGLGIVTLMAVLSARNLESQPAVGIAIAVIVAVQLFLLIKFLLAIDPKAKLSSVLRIRRASQT